MPSEGQRAPQVHWLGAGLSSRAGIRRLLTRLGGDLVLWNRTPATAQALLHALGASTHRARPLQLSELRSALLPADVVVSMLPAPMHPDIARLCIERGAHFVSTSYTSPEMRSLDGAAQERGLTLLNEVGLDPGLDHMLAHQLVHELVTAGFEGGQISFRSFCGGFPEFPGALHYKFSWSPMGVLRALKTPARWIENGEERHLERPYERLWQPRIRGDTFEAYPNRDSLPYLTSYGVDSRWRVQDFVRGTLRPAGWSGSWKGVLEQLQASDETSIEALSRELWSRHAYAEGERDRVVLHVELTARSVDGRRFFGRAHTLDLVGSFEESAMARLVSLPASLAVENLLSEGLPAGVIGPPEQPDKIRAWLGELDAEGVRLRAGETANWEGSRAQTSQSPQGGPAAP